MREHVRRADVLYQARHYGPEVYHLEYYTQGKPEILARPWCECMAAIYAKHPQVLDTVAVACFVMCQTGDFNQIQLWCDLINTGLSEVKAEGRVRWHAGSCPAIRNEEG